MDNDVYEMGTHAAHCCKEHGCKYGDDSLCAVARGIVKQEYPCETCQFAAKQKARYAPEIADLRAKLAAAEAKLASLYSLPALTSEQLAEIEARANAATAGPWYDDRAIAGSGSVVMSEAIGFRVAHLPSTKNVTNHSANAAFIAHARTDVPALVTEVRRLTASLATAVDANARLRDLLRAVRAMTDGVTQIGIDDINRMRVLIFDGLNPPEMEPKP